MCACVRVAVASAMDWDSFLTEAAQQVGMNERAVTVVQERAVNERVVAATPIDPLDEYTPQNISYEPRPSAARAPPRPSADNEPVNSDDELDQLPISAAEYAEVRPPSPPLRLAPLHPVPTSDPRMPPANLAAIFGSTQPDDEFRDPFINPHPFFIFNA